MAGKKSFEEARRFLRAPQEAARELAVRMEQLRRWRELAERTTSFLGKERVQQQACSRVESCACELAGSKRRSTRCASACTSCAPGRRRCSEGWRTAGFPSCCGCITSAISPLRRQRNTWAIRSGRSCGCTRWHCVRCKIFCKRAAGVTSRHSMSRLPCGKVTIGKKERGPERFPFSFPENGKRREAPCFAAKTETACITPSG